MDASEIYSKRINAKEVMFPKDKGEFIFPIADVRTKPLGGCQHLCAHIGSVGFVYLLHLSCVPPS